MSKKKIEDMANKVFFKAVVVMTSILLQTNLWGQVSKTIHVAEAGTLSSLIDANQKDQITDLVLTGKLNGTDIQFIREMAGRDYNGNITNGKLVNLNLEGTNINVTGEGKGRYFFYLGYDYTYFNFNNCIPPYMFFECWQLKNIILPNNINSIFQEAFLGCGGLTNIVIPFGVTKILYGAFIGCSNLTNITIPNSVTDIDYQVFMNCWGFTSFTIPNSVTKIGGEAFRGCKNLISITIPNSVNEIGAAAFNDCIKLTEIHSKNQNPPLLNSLCFYNVNKTTCKLFVPKGSSTIYRNWGEWGEFQNIIEESATAINTIKKEKDNITIQPISNGISIETKEQTFVSIYNLSGQKICQSIINGNAEIRLIKGLYIVEVGNEIRRIFVQ